MRSHWRSAAPRSRAAWEAASGVAGQIYRDLHQRFGTPTHLQISDAPDDEEKVVAAEGDDLIAGDNKGTDQTDESTTTADGATATATSAPARPTTHKLVPESSPSNVKLVLN